MPTQTAAYIGIGFGQYRRIGHRLLDIGHWILDIGQKLRSDIPSHRPTQTTVSTAVFFLLSPDILAY